MADQVQGEAFKAALRRFASGVTVITCAVDGVDHAMTASAFSAVSLEPPLVLVCVRANARFAEAVARTDRWGVSILDEEGESAARWFATSGRTLIGQLDVVPHHRGASGVALLESSLARLECRTVSVTEAGDHNVVVGQVDALELSQPGPPLLYFDGGYRTLRR